MTHMGDQESHSVYERLPDNLGELTYMLCVGQSLHLPSVRVDSVYKPVLLLK